MVPSVSKRRGISEPPAMVPTATSTSWNLSNFTSITFTATVSAPVFLVSLISFLVKRPKIFTTPQIKKIASTTRAPILINFFLLKSPPRPAGRGPPGRGGLGRASFGGGGKGTFAPGLGGSAGFPVAFSSLGGTDEGTAIFAWGFSASFETTTPSAGAGEPAGIGPESGVGGTSEVGFSSIVFVKAS